MKHFRLLATLGQALLLLACCSRPDSASQRIATHTPPTSSNPTKAAMKTPAPSFAVATNPLVTAAIAEARKGGKTVVNYRAPSAQEYGDYVALVRPLLAPEAPPAPTLPHGFVLRHLGNEYRLLAEQPEQKRGAVALVIRQGERLPLAVEVPHSFFDEGTLELGLDVFLRGRAAVLLVNTAHRYRDPAASSDVAHARVSYFLAAHEAFLAAYPRSVTLQLHGYSDDSAPDFDLVVSAANTKTQVAPLAARLRAEFGWRIAVYPKDARKLGGTTNVQAALSRSQGACFLHIEIAQSLRSSLRKDTALLARFSDVLLAEAHCP